MNEPTLDPVSVAVAVATLLVGPKLAPVLGAYTLILFGWFAGVLIGVYRRDAGSRMGTAVFVVVMFIVTMGSTVSAAELVAAHLPYFKSTASALLFPVSILIPAVGDDWISISRWAWRLLAARFERSQGGQ